MHVESNRMAALRRVACLRYVGASDLARLAEVAQDVVVPAGSVVQHAGPMAASLAVVVDGTANLWRASTLIGQVGAGEFVCNRPPLDILTRGARVVAQTSMRMLTLPVDMVAVMLDDKAIAATMLNSALAGLRRPVTATASA